MAVASTSLLSLRLSCSSSLRPTTRPSSLSLTPLKGTVQWSYGARIHSYSLRVSPNRAVSAVVNKEEEEDSEEGFGDNRYGNGLYDGNDDNDDDDVVSGREWNPNPITKSTPCELYVCNLPRSFDIPELAQMFKPFGTVISVEISRNPENGTSRGSGFVALDSVESAKAAISALDTSDVEGREMRVRFSTHMNPKRRNNVTMLMNSKLVKSMVYESPHKLYIGNLAWTVEPEDLRRLFGRFGHVVSVRVLHDRKGGKTRAYAFVTFSTAEELDAAKALDGEELSGRVMVVRDGTLRE